MAKQKIGLLFFAYNFILSLVIESQYIFISSDIDNIGLWYLFVALISNTFMIYFALYLITFWVNFLKDNRQVLYTLAGIFTILQIAMLCDVAIYKVFKFHINGVIINFLTTPDSFQSIALGFITYVSAFALIVSIIVFEFLLARWLIKKEQSKLKFSWLFIILLLFVTIDKLAYMYADIFNNTSITRHSKLFPLYQGLTSKSLARKLGIKVNRESEFKFNTNSSSLNYPLTPLELGENVKKPNILWIVLDAFRYDMLTPEVAPNLFDFAKKSQNFKNHYSGGISTRFGIFSMYYGIYSYNWHQFLSEKRSPIFIDTLQKLGYTFSINSSTSLAYPEFRKTAFVNITDSINDAFSGGNSAEKDLSQINYFIDSLSNLERDKPFFSFVFLDAPHSRVYPADFEKFKTDSKQTNYLFVGADDAKQAKLNYMNAIFYNDYLLKRVLDTLEKQKLMENTIIVITGDHGEEFYEHGSFSHNSAFSHYQSKVPFIMYVPWLEPKEYSNMTSHLDIVSTFFELMNIKNVPESYSNGASMLNESNRSYAVICQWSKCAYDNGKSIITFSMETHSAGYFEYRDLNYTLKNSKPNNEEKTQLFEIMKDFSRFFK
ncbi:sulfatase-like hydrolase/transferase [Campylobacter mucosalis]|uniref:sulfatase-like hydrolase/transferase n=1 Tax=Campylobacter mucosalis TaxID=202 RepID=UPI00147008DC|nr:sulfatase-like hydrolase/transferase [Campylobacter mucosalis]